MRAKGDWSAWTDPDEAARRAAGRRHYNAHRRLLAELRRCALLAYLRQTDPIPWGRGRELADRFGVSRATISRDLARVLYLPMPW
jgi:hypothetical protein